MIRLGGGRSAHAVAAEPTRGRPTKPVRTLHAGHCSRPPCRDAQQVFGEKRELVGYEAFATRRTR
ncbi:MAG: hypothetical protein M3Z25_16115 [Actinomycetota bacterium]|nr:hypothetical protein [Actinomycetota bacterium]